MLYLSFATTLYLVQKHRTCTQYDESLHHCVSAKMLCLAQQRRISHKNELCTNIVSRSVLDLCVHLSYSMQDATLSHSLPYVNAILGDPTFLH